MLWPVHQGDCSFLLHCRSTYYVDCRCLCGLLHKKKKKTQEMQLLCRFTVGNGRTRFYFLAELYLLFMMYWSLRWEFLVGFCVALCFSCVIWSLMPVQRSFDLHMFLTPEGPQLAQTLWFSFAFFFRSPFGSRPSLGWRAWKSPRSGCSGSRGVFSEQLPY